MNKEGIVIGHIEKIRKELGIPKPKFKIGDRVKTNKTNKSFHIKEYEYVYTEKMYKYQVHKTDCSRHSYWEDELKLTPLTIEDANPCPFCGNEPLSTQKENGTWWLWCGNSRNCGFESPTRLTEHEAIQDWNRIRLEDENERD